MVQQLLAPLLVLPQPQARIPELIYLSKLSNVLQNALVQIAKCICSNCKIYLFKARAAKKWTVRWLLAPLRLSTNPSPGLLPDQSGFHRRRGGGEEATYRSLR